MSRRCVARSCQSASQSSGSEGASVGSGPSVRFPAGAVVRETIELGAVTGGNDQRFTHPGQAGEFSQGIRQLLARKDHFFADIDGRGAVIDSYDDEWHAGCCRERVRIVREGPTNDKRAQLRIADGRRGPELI